MKAERALNKSESGRESVYYTMKLNVRLNDFASFDQVLFNAEGMALPEKERWKKFYHDDKEAIFIPLPNMPTTISEYQFCHYIYWMTIWANELTYKPWIYFSFMGKVTKPVVASACFACEYVVQERLEYTDYCPIKLYRCVLDKRCVENENSPYSEWIEATMHLQSYSDLSTAKKDELNACTYAIAHLEWEEKNEDNCQKREVKTPVDPTISDEITGRE